jgi:hypothetical protein
MTMKANMICFRFGDEVELGREDRMVMDALNRLVHPETPSYSLCTCGQCSGGFISPRTARILEWIAKNVYALLTIREATKGAGSALVDNATSPVVLFMRPALVVAMGAYHVPRLAYMAVLNYIRICFSRERSEVPTVAHICSFNPAEVSASTARAYFLVWDGKLASVMVPLLEIAARLNTMPPAGWPQDAAMYGLLVEWWSKHFNAKQLTELETELQTMPKCEHDERWGYVRAQLGVGRWWGACGGDVCHRQLTTLVHPGSYAQK